MITVEQAQALLADTGAETLPQPLAAYVVAVELQGQQLRIDVTVPIVNNSSLCERAAKRLQPALGETTACFNYVAPSGPVQQSLSALQGVKNTIVVASGKGGVGKSTTAVNLALALQALGARTGMLDADIYGPSVQMMLGVTADVRPGQAGSNFLPVAAHGLQTMSIAYLVTEKTPMIWRGPMASGALQQMLQQTRWHDLDFLVIDMPPGTGDIQLTLSQQLPLTGAVVVTTPQNIALLDAQKGIEMFRKVGVPVFGVVENMAWHECSACGFREAIFGSGGGARLAGDYNAELLGQLPLKTAIREQADGGKPTVIAAAESKESQAYRTIALRLAAAVAGTARTAAPTIAITDE